MHLLTIEQYCKQEHIDRRTFFRWQSDGRITTLKMDGRNYVYSAGLIMKFNDADKQKIFEAKKTDWMLRLRSAHLLYKQAGKPIEAATKEIKLIFAEVEYFKNLGFKITGYDLRSLQMKVKTGKVERSLRHDNPRNHIIKSYPMVLDKAVHLTASYFKDSNGSVNLAIDRAIAYAKENENYFEVAALNIHTLRRHIRKIHKQSGFRTLHEFLNHYNLFNSHRAYAKGSFTNDIDFMQVYSLDDHKFDIAGVQVWNAAKGEFEQKKIYSWFVVELKTMMWLAYEIKTTPFTDEDIVKLLMKTLKTWGAPAEKIICDQGLAASNRIKEFCQKLEIILDPQAAYSPTKKAPNERIFKFFKEETDCYELNYVGSNHPVEGRHESLKLSPEATLALESEAIKRYDNYVNGFYLDRPRRREIKGTEELCDNSGRVSIRNLFDHYYVNHERKEVTDIQLRYAYMEHDIVKNFKDFYITFKKEIYIPAADTDISLVLYDPSYRYIIAYDPNDFNRIDLYAAQDIIDRLNGELHEKGKRIGTFESIANLPADEKKRKVSIYNKQVRKKTLELARSLREQYSIDKPLVNAAIGNSGVLLNIRKEQETAVAAIIKRGTGPDKIEVAIENAVPEPVNMEEATSDESINSLNAINIEE